MSSVWFAIWVTGIVAAGGGMLWWSWRHVDVIVPVPVSGPHIGLVPCLGSVVTPPADGEGELAGRLIGGRLPAEDYRAGMERLAAADAGRPGPVPDLPA